MHRLAEKRTDYLLQTSQGGIFMSFTQNRQANEKNQNPHKQGGSQPGSQTQQKNSQNH